MTTLANRDERLRPAFIAKSYPPVLGGMEAVSFHLARELRAIGETEVYANPRGAIAFPLFAPVSTLKAAARVRSGRVNLVHLSDALMAPFGYGLKLMSGVPVTATVHGLDVSRRSPAGYQQVIGPSVSRLDHLIAVSASTRDHCLQRWPQLEGRITFIPNGVAAPECSDELAVLSNELAQKLAGRFVVLSAGRLIRRKGVAWFAQQVLPLLPEQATYVVAGAGPERDAIEAAARAAGQGGRVMLTGVVSRPLLEALYRRADVFVMPNIAVPNDPEGFGLVSLEASVQGTPVIAADLQGIPDAIHHGCNGFLVPPQNAAAFAAAIGQIAGLSESERRTMGERFRAYTAKHFAWPNIARCYWDCFESVVARHSNRA